LYVALTRARDYLILTASITEKSWDEKWRQPHTVNAQSIAAGHCYADWLALWFSQSSPPPPGAPGKTGEDDGRGGWFPNGKSEPAQLAGTGRGGFKPLRWRLVDDDESNGPSGDTVFAAAISDRPSAIGHGSEPELERLRSRLEWSYPFMAATRRKAKSSVTAVWREAEEWAEESEPLHPAADAPTPSWHRVTRGSTLSAAEIGAAHHKFLQHLALEQTRDLAAEAERLVRKRYLTRAEQASLNLAALASFWDSATGRAILSQPENVRRELPFTARFTPRELARITGVEADAGLENEQVMVQGVADLVVLRPDEIWLVDFKTDQVPESELAGKVRTYSPQLQLYALAFEKIFRRRATLLALHFLATGRTAQISRSDRAF
jgi:ATP-dependent helicase/nuclease subunit A